MLTYAGPASLNMLPLTTSALFQEFVLPALELRHGRLQVYVRMLAYADVCVSRVCAAST
jgi:hypothetical protein